MNDIKQYIDNSNLDDLVSNCNGTGIQSIILTQKSNSFETHPTENRGCGIGVGEADKLYNKILKRVKELDKSPTITYREECELKEKQIWLNNFSELKSTFEKIRDDGWKTEYGNPLQRIIFKNFQNFPQGEGQERRIRDGVL